MVDGGHYSAGSEIYPDSPALSPSRGLRTPSRQRRALIKGAAHQFQSASSRALAQVRFPGDVPLPRLPHPFRVCAARNPGTSESWVKGKQKPGPSLVPGFEMAQSGVGQEGDKRGCDPLLSGCLECKVTVVLPQPSPRENVKT